MQWYFSKLQLLMKLLIRSILHLIAYKLGENWCHFLGNIVVFVAFWFLDTQMLLHGALSCFYKICHVESRDWQLLSSPTCGNQDKFIPGRKEYSSIQRLLFSIMVITLTVYFMFISCLNALSYWGNFTFRYSFL